MRRVKRRLTGLVPGGRRRRRARRRDFARAGEPTTLVALDGADRHLLFISKPSGYELVERPGGPPAPGTEVEVGEDGSARFVVSKIAPSPLPGDERRCAYLQPK